MVCNKNKIPSCIYIWRERKKESLLLGMSRDGRKQMIKSSTAESKYTVCK
jgi:hypothetical protein